MAVTVVPAPAGSTSLGAALTNISNMILQTEALKLEKKKLKWGKKVDKTRLGFEAQRVGFEGERVGIERERAGMERQRLGIAEDYLDIARNQLGLEGQRVELEGRRVGLAEDYLGIAQQQFGLEERRVGVAEGGLEVEKGRAAAYAQSVRNQARAFKREQRRQRGIFRMLGDKYPEVVKLRTDKAALEQRKKEANDLNNFRKSQTVLDFARQISDVQKQQSLDLQATITRVDKDIDNLRESLPLMGPYTQEQMNTFQSLQNIKADATKKYLTSLGASPEQAATVERSIISETFYPRNPRILELTAANARTQVLASMITQSFDNITEIVNVINKEFDLEPEDRQRLEQALWNRAMFQLGSPMSGEVGKKEPGTIVDNFVNFLFPPKIPVTTGPGSPANLLDQGLLNMGLPVYSPDFLGPSPEEEERNLVNEYMENIEE